MPLPDDAPPGRALELVEDLGRVAVGSGSGSGAVYAVRVWRRRPALDLLKGGLVGVVASQWLTTASPQSVPLVLVVALVVVPAALWVLRAPASVRAWVQVDRFTPEEEVGGTVAWVGVRRVADLADAVDALVARCRDGSLDDRPEHHGIARTRLRWRRAPA